jgi:UDP-glucose 4-epimerase
MAKYLVTGGCGFIGSHLCDALLSRGDEVRVLDDLSTGKRENLASGAEFVYGSVTDAALVRRAVTDIEGCFHLAAIASVERGVHEWLYTHQVNVGGTVTIFDAVRDLPNQVPVVYASSAAVYGEPSSIPLEESSEKRPLSAYGADKYGCELHAAVGTTVHGIPTVGLRFFNVYGPRQDPNSPYSGVISIFAEKISRDQSITIFGDGKQTRDFVYVADVAQALLAAMALRPALPEVLNVCSGKAISVLDLAERIARVAGRRPQLSFGEARLGDIRNSVGSRALSRGRLGLAAPVELDTGLRELLAWSARQNAGLTRSAEEPALRLRATN